ncbi:trifunctional purine biosynthetic protein adenosine-3-like [Lineus longissimus]|uniref:trifunctional purine biosynthetic protein adenosine-3-like n=1 Tax=Lineus longissimus TaxID=88925 RepID=UPI002B4E3FD2
MAKVLVLGSGGREHALSWKLSLSKHVQKVYVAPGNAGTLNIEKVENVGINVKDFPSVASWCKENVIDLVVVGPEDPLANGVADVLKDAGIDCFGPSAKAAQIEASKEFAKKFMSKYNIPTARWKSFTNSKAACEHIMSCNYLSLVVKASGLAAGKGVVVAANKEDACVAVKKMVEEKAFGSAGDTVIVEELLCGEEVSCLAFTDGYKVACFPPAQDHKRLKDGDDGPNTGGMGAYAPCQIVNKNELDRIKNLILQRAVDGMRSEGTPYMGLLYAGLMMTTDGPKVLEFNCRFGDPETQVLLPLMKSDLYLTMKSCIAGDLADNMPLFHRTKHTVGVMLVSGGYPGSYPKGIEITGMNRVDTDAKHIIFHSGTAMKDDKLVTNGGRVLAVVAIKSDLGHAIREAQLSASMITFDGCYYRKDIGYRAILRSSRGVRLSYKDSGVDISAGDSLVQAIKPVARSTSRPGCQVDLGMFGGMFDLKAAGYEDPLLVSGTDGVGTKLKIAQVCGIHNTVGIDLVAMCVNDVLAHNAEPLFFLDYFACGELDVWNARGVIEGVAEGCQLAGCALLGGETAEMPGMYPPGEFDLAGFTVGAVGKNQLLPKIDDITKDDVIIGIASSGVHSNGLSLVRKIVEVYKMNYSQPSPFMKEKSLGESLLIPTKIYSKTVLPALRSGKVKAFAHITGGGLLENIPRVLPDSHRVELDASLWNIPTVFGWIAAQGHVDDLEMARTFNCGVGATLIVSRDNKQAVLDMLSEAGETAWCIGRVLEDESDGMEDKVIISNLQQELDNLLPEVEVKHATSHGEVNGRGRMRVAVLISGSGTNLQALIDHTQDLVVNSAADIALVISNVAGVKGLERAKDVGIPTKVISHKDYKTRLDFDMAVDSALNEAGIELICLAGFMRILTGEFTKKWTGKLLNVHPSLLPLFKGAHAHRDVLESGVRISGCTVHFVAEEVDAGAILVQESVPVYPDDTQEILQERVKEKEHVAFPAALEIVASGKAHLDIESNKIVWNKVR